MVLCINRRELEMFRRECKRAFPNETVAVLFGERIEHGLRIDRIEVLPHTGDENGLQVQDRHIRNSKIKALRQQSDWLGTIHSHGSTPDCSTCPHLSDTDIRSAIKMGETICGVVHVYNGGKNTEICWQVPTPVPTVRYL